MGESQHPDPGSGMNNPDHIFYSLETIFLLFWGLKYLNSLMRIRDPRWRLRDGKKSDLGSGINIPDPPHCYFHSLLRLTVLDPFLQECGGKGQIPEHGPDSVPPHAGHGGGHCYPGQAPGVR
jgi:hypothetical protein